MSLRNYFLLILVVMILMNPLGMGRAKADEADNVKIHITDVSRTIHKNWLGVPKNADCTVLWEMYERDQNTWSLSVNPFFDAYRVRCLSRPDGMQVLESDIIESNFWTFDGLKLGVEYRFFVEGYRDNQKVAVSDTARIVAGRQLKSSVPGANVHWTHWIPFNGRIPLAFFGRGYVFDVATRAGKIAFHLIWNFWIGGFIIWLFYCVRHLSLRRIFPIERGINFGGSFDSVYNKGVSEEFKEIIDDWHDLAGKANEHMRLSLDKGNHVSLEEIERINIEFWRKEGIEKVNALLEKTNKPRMSRYPAVRIIRAGLENHEMGGFRWIEVSKEVDRAIENRASSEMERLRRTSLLDWLWNLGTLAPLVGLFGTATGISHAFVTLTMLRGDITQTSLVRRLAEGIFEALWTTIEGLFVGILLMLLYYYYNNKLNWIYSKWEEIYVHISERL